MSGDRYDSLEKQIDALTCEGCRLGLGTEIVADYPSHHFPSGYRKGWKICTAQGKAIMELVRQAAPPPQTEPLSRGADYKSDLYADLADEDYAIGYLKKCFADSVEASHQGVRDVISASLIAGGSKGIGSPPSPDERTEQIRAKLQTKEGCWVADSGDVWYLLKRLDAAQTVVLAHDFVLHPAMDVFDEATKTHFPIRSPKTMVTTVGEHAEIWEVHEEDVTQFWYCYETESRTWACNLFKEVEP